jgi:hypothetical protein
MAFARLLGICNRWGRVAAGLQFVANGLPALAAASMAIASIFKAAA